MVPDSTQMRQRTLPWAIRWMLATAFFTVGMFLIDLGLSRSFSPIWKQQFLLWGGLMLTVLPFFMILFFYGMSILLPGPDTQDPSAFAVELTVLQNPQPRQDGINSEGDGHQENPRQDANNDGVMGMTTTAVMSVAAAIGPAETNTSCEADGAAITGRAFAGRVGGTLGGGYEAGFSGHGANRRGSHR